GAGYTPVLMNTRLADEVLEGVLSTYHIPYVISDGKTFSCKTVLQEALLPSDEEYTPRPFGDEVIFMSSGTTKNVKLCAYNGENFYYQILDSAHIIKACPKIKTHYEGQLKQLVLLPLCHVFGFIAVYLWFGFFSRTFVFPRDLSPDTIQKTVKKHKVTHIFAVPMVWEAVHKAALRKIRERGERTYKRFLKMKKLVNRLDGVGDALARRFLSEVREGLFGDSVCFMITGGSHINSETLSFFSGIGYHLVNGYGMTEIGITSLETTSKKKLVAKASIGAPFGFTEYSVSPSGVLLVRGKTRASRILQGGEVTETNYDAWFPTGDIVRCDGSRYYFDGREDDLIVLEDGENINPLLLEISLMVDGADRVCILRAGKGVTVLASVPGVFSESRLGEIHDALLRRIDEVKLTGAVKNVLFTHEPLLLPSEFKLNRRKLASRVDCGEIRTFDARFVGEHMRELEEGMEREVALCFADALCIECDSIGPDDDFFRDLNGTSLDYFTLLSHMKSRLGVDVMTSADKKLSSVSAFVEYIKAEDKQ
ncbi:MAG: non-ribosomal peptide synthetase, partial [Clostridia bacterium]|nr:non-ribosomal peptide synthetase [Clostridia bacterium]